MNTPAESFGPWHPGLRSEIPRELLPLSTMFRPENVSTRIDDVLELHDLTGLELHELVAFRPERLALHELLVRVTADLHVPSGTRVEDLGINFRRMTGAILAGGIAPRMGEAVAAYDALRHEVEGVVRAELDARLFGRAAAAAPAPAPRPSFLRRLFGAPREAAPVDEPYPDGDRERAAIAAWQAAAQAGAGARRAACRALARVVGALVGRHGRLWGTPDLIASVATNLACNDLGSDEVGRAIEPLFLDAARREGYRLLPAQDRPVIMNTKGASAAGKSTMRAEQRMLSERIGADWQDFALISPDIWRKQLLDYASLGAAYKYGGAFTGDELRIIDQKLDRYMARKGERRAISHLLIDRFRFDSFAPDSDEAGSNLLTRFGHRVYLFFMLTPPEALVERAWKRGLEVGRYKAVDDVLAHAIEAYTGMPRLFFTWALREDKDVHCEFLDNTVPLGERPRTAAFGWNGDFVILDARRLLDVQRFRRVDVNASGPGELFRDPAELAPGRNTDFVVECARRLPRLSFAEPSTGRVYLRIEGGKPAWADPEALRAALDDPETRAAVVAIVPDVERRALPAPPAPVFLADELGAERDHTLGRWGEAGPEPSRSTASRERRLSDRDGSDRQGSPA